VSAGFALLLGAVASTGQQQPAAKPLPKGAFAKNVELVGFTDLAGRPSFKMAVQQAGSHWYLYLGAIVSDTVPTGWNIVDVTGHTGPKSRWRAGQ
jgi:hypothetical protein